AGIGADGLGDALLTVTVSALDLPDGDEPLYPLLTGFANTDEDAGSKENLQLAGLAQHPYAHGRLFVWRGEVGHAFLAQPRADVLQHEPQTDVDVLEHFHLVVAQHASVGMRQEAVGEG